MGALPGFVAKLAAHQGEQRLVVLLDQNLDYRDTPHATSFKGTDLCRMLREQYCFGGLIFIQSADDDAESEKAYIGAGADGCLGKGLKHGHESLLRKLAVAYWHKYPEGPVKRAPPAAAAAAGSSS